MNPKIIVNTQKLRENIQFLTTKLKNNDLSITTVTKVFNADPKIIRIYNEFPEIQYFGDSRIQNIKSYQESPKEKILIRIPMHSEIEEVVKYTDISFNSELSTIQLLDKAAKSINKIHKIVIMVDLGDLREGYFYKEDLMATVAEVMNLENIELFGLAVNLTCYGAVIPEYDNLQKLVDYKEEIETKYSIELPMISGGNSSSLYLLDSSDSELPKGITNLRIGESFVLGRETAYEKEYEEMHQDVFTLQTEIVELKTKPSLPVGNIGVDAFGNKPYYEDKGKMLRAIVGIGQQDVDYTSIIPKDSKIDILGASSDHLLLDVTNCDYNYQVGDTIDFNISYGSLLSTFTSKYVSKEYI